MSDFKVTPDVISAAAQSCNTTADDVANSLASLRSYVVGLENSWQGIAQNTFQDLMLEYDRYSQMLHQALVDIGSGLQGNYVNYTEAEAANIQSIDGIKATLAAAKLN
jgi:WXG100 family type VII secretion target